VSLPVYADSAPPNVLVADDDDILREGIARLLRAKGYRVVTVRDGIEAMGVLRRTAAIDLLLLDLNMPRLDGTGVLAGLSRERRLPNLAVVVMTAAPDRAPPSVTTIAKPFDVDSLLELVGPLIHRARPAAAGAAPSAAGFTARPRTPTV
jgi:two-component system KDP operon response regulator KdpE